MRNVALVLSLLAAIPAVAAELPCGTVGGNPAAVEEALAAAALKAASAGDTVVDVGLLYDPSFAKEAGGDAAAVVELLLAIARANVGHEGSATHMRYRVAGVRRLSYTLDPHRPLETADSAETRAFRDSVGADLVLVGTLRPYNSAGIEIGGIAWVYDATPTRYLSVVGYYAVEGITPGHELGHLGGADHEPAAVPPPTQPLPARAFYICPPGGGEGWGDMMTSGTSRPAGGCNWEDVNLYSTPSVLINGIPLGIPGKADNASVLRATAAIVAGFRPSKASPSVCTPGPQALCLQGGRFKVEAVWRAGNQTGHGYVVPLTSDTGYLWFFDAGNVEVLVKVLNGCGLGGHFWVFAGGLTNVEVALTVTDTKTGMVKTYYSEPGPPFEPLQDTAAFVCN